MDNSTAVQLLYFCTTWKSQFIRSTMKQTLWLSKGKVMSVDRSDDRQSWKKYSIKMQNLETHFLDIDNLKTFTYPLERTKHLSRLIIQL